MKRGRSDGRNSEGGREGKTCRMAVSEMGEGWVGLIQMSGGKEVWSECRCVGCWRTIMEVQQWHHASPLFVSMCVSLCSGVCGL